MRIQIAFRKNSKPFTPTQSTEISCKFVRQTSGLDRYAHVELSIEPIAPSTYCSEFSWEVSEDQIPFIYFDSVLEGIKRAMEREDAPFDHLQSTRIRVIGGSYNEIDSSPMCYMYACYLGVSEYFSEQAADAA
jgi:translation elongation factor EF-G